MHVLLQQLPASVDLIAVWLHGPLLMANRSNDVVKPTSMSIEYMSVTRLPIQIYGSGVCSTSASVGIALLAIYSSDPNSAIWRFVHHTIHLTPLCVLADCSGAKANSLE